MWRRNKESKTVRVFRPSQGSWVAEVHALPFSKHFDSSGYSHQPLPFSNHLDSYGYSHR